MDAATSVGGEDEEINGFRAEDVADIFRYGTLAQEGDGRNFLGVGELLEGVEVGLEIEFELEHGAGKDGGHAIRGLVGHDMDEHQGRAVDFGDVDGAPKCGFGGLGEVDGDQNPFDLGDSYQDGRYGSRVGRDHMSHQGRHAATSILL